jgi:hypothetical protein
MIHRRLGFRLHCPFIIGAISPQPCSLRTSSNMTNIAIGSTVGSTVGSTIRWPMPKFQAARMSPVPLRLARAPVRGFFKTLINLASPEQIFPENIRKWCLSQAASIFANIWDSSS